MFRQPPGSGQPPPLPPDYYEGSGRGGDLDNRNIHRSIPINSDTDRSNNDPGAAIEAIDAIDAIEVDDAPSIPSSFALLSALRQQNLRTWPRQRRRDSKSPRPAVKSQQSQPQPQSQSQSQTHQQQQPLASSSSTPLHQPTPIPPDVVLPPPFHSPLSSLLALPPVSSAFLHHRSRDTKRPKQPRQRRRMPYPLNANAQERSPSHSPPLLPSPPPSAPSVSETPRDVEQLAGEFSRQQLERTTTSGIRSTGDSISISGSGSGSGFSSGPVSRNGSRHGSRYGDAFANFSPAMAEFRLRRGGNEPVMDLEVDMDQESRNDDGDCQIRPRSPLPPFASASQFGPSSSYADSIDIETGPAVPMGLQRMRMRQVTLADASVRHLDLGLKPFPRQLSPETDASQDPQPPPVAPVTETAQPPVSAPDTAPTIQAPTPAPAPAPAPVVASTGLAALAAAESIEVGDDELAPLPMESMAMMAPYPQRNFHLHSHSYSRSYHSQAMSYSRSLPHSRPHSRQLSISSRGGAPSSHCLPLSPEALAMPHLAPLHNDVPSSGYDMQGWLSSSSTVEAAASLTTGTIDNCSQACSTDGGVAKNDTSVTPHQTTGNVTEGVLPNTDNRSDRPSTEASSTKALSLASERRQQSKQFYTAYLQPHQFPCLHDNTGTVPNPPVDMLEADMEGPNTSGIDDRIATIPEEADAMATATATPTPASGSGSGSATASHATNQDSTETTTQYMIPSQRVRLIQMAMAREAERIRSESSAYGSSANGSAVIASEDQMDVEMADPTAIEASGALSALGSSVVDGSLIGSLPPLWGPDQPSDIRKYMGPFRYRLSSEVAMRCTNLVHSKPRMRRRRQPGEDSETATTNDGGSSLRSGSHKDGGSSRHSERRSERRRERHRERAREREERDSNRDPNQSRESRERPSRASRHREQHARLITVHAESQKHAISPTQPSPPPDPLMPPVPDPALMQVEYQQPTTTTEQQPLPEWRPPVPEPIDAATEMS
ncbi:hypothetical protein Sste5346_000415 [Sporothrix stenoceras]|uniref:Uncharacterized protein n=1 Tax=Sporothrix stenoceras TaxID=5173 RepID=A0ABR3ZSH5_9PEZI